MFDPEVLQILGLNLMAGKSPNFAENLGNAGLATLQYQRQREEDKLRKEEREFLKQQREMQMEQLKRQQRAQQQQEALYQRFVQPELPPVPYNDTLGSEAPQPSIPGTPASFNMEGYMAALPSLGPHGLEQAMRMQQAMGPEFMSVAEGGALVNKRTGQPVFQNAKPKDAFRPLTNAEAAKLGLPPGLAYQVNTATNKIDAVGSRAPVTNVTTNVNNPKETFKDSLTLKKDFDSQPEVKGFKEVRQAWDQISTALSNPSGANDLTAATKFMKLLDPGSVVRESELAMAMQATGALDRFANYHNQLLNGQKLTPNQRKDFFAAGKALHDAAKSRFDQTVNQYQGIAQQYELDPSFIARGDVKLAKNTTKLVEGRQAIARGVPREQVIQRLIESGYDPEGL